MRVLLVLLVLSILAGGVLLSSHQAYAQQYPQVAGLRPFYPESNYMSLPGYLRWQVFVEQGNWIARSEAAEIVASQPVSPMSASLPSSSNVSASSSMPSSSGTASNSSPASPDSNVEMGLSY